MKTGERKNMQKMIKIFCAVTLFTPAFAMADVLPKVLDREIKNEMTQIARQEYMANYDKIAKKMLPTVQVQEIRPAMKSPGVSAIEPYYVGHGAFVVSGEAGGVVLEQVASSKARILAEVPMAPVHGVIKGGQIIEKGMVFWNNHWVSLEEFARYYSHDNIRFVIGEKSFTNPQQLIGAMEKTYNMSLMRKQLEMKFNANMFDPVLNEEARKMLVANDVYRKKTAEIAVERAGRVTPAEHKIQQARAANAQWRASAEKLMNKTPKMQSILKYRSFFYKGIFSVAMVAGLTGLEMLISRIDNALNEDYTLSANTIHQSMQARQAMLQAVEETPVLGLWLPEKDKEYILTQEENPSAKEHLLGALLEYASFALQTQEEGTPERDALLEVEQQAAVSATLASALS